MQSIILDRDGVINLDSDAYVKSSEEWIPIAGSLEAISRLQAAGYTVCVATNQSGLGRGLFKMADLEAMHAKFSDLLIQAGGQSVDIAYCPHAPDDQCDCRKPKPGLLKQLAERHQLDLHNTIVVGDSLRDLEAAQAVGADAILVLTGKGTRTQQQHPNLPFPIFADLAHVAEHLLRP